MTKPYRGQPDDRIPADPANGSNRIANQLRTSLMEKDRVLRIGFGSTDPLVPPVGAAPVDEAFVTIGNTSGLTAERALTGTANQITVTDGGANGAVTLSTPQNLDTAAQFQVDYLGVGVAANPATARVLVSTGGLLPGLRIEAPLSVAGPSIVFRDTDSGTSKTLQATGFTGGTIFSLPDGATVSSPDFLVSRTSTDTMSNKTLANGTIIRTGSSSTGSRWQDGSVATKQVFPDLTGATGNNQLIFTSSSARVWTVPNYTGTFAVPVDEGTSGTVLVSGGAGVQPAWTSLSSGGIAPSGAQYVVLSASAGLSAERVLTGTANQITITDGGPNNPVTLSAPQNLHTAAVFQVAQLGIGAAATSSPAIHLDVTGRSRWVLVSQSFSASQTNYDIGSSTLLRLTATNPALLLRGFTNGVDGRFLFVFNAGSNIFTIPNENSSATAANRIHTSTGQDLTVSPDDGKLLIYDGTTSRWRGFTWCSPVSDEVIIGTWTFQSQDDVIIDGTTSAGAATILRIDGDIGSGAPPQIRFNDPGAGTTVTLDVPAIDASCTVDLPGSFTSRVQVCGDTAVTAGNAVAANVLGKHDSTGNTGNIAATTLGKTVRAGMYRLDWYINITTAGDAIGTDNLKITAAWNDGGAQTKDLQPMNEVTPVSPFAVDTLNKAYSGTCVVYSAASQDVSFSTTLVNGGATNPQYTCRVRLEAMA